MKGNGAPGPPSPTDATEAAATEAAAKHKAESILANRAPVFAAARAVLDRAIGRAIAGVLLDKPANEVTPEEAAAAIFDLHPSAPGGRGCALSDPHKTYRAHRAGIMAMVAELASARIVDPAVAQLIEDVLLTLDSGEALGWATPAPNKRQAPGMRALMQRWFATEVTFQRVSLGCPHDYAIGLTADEWRDEKRPDNAPAPILPWHVSFEALRKHFKAGVALDKARASGAIAEAAAEGKKVAAGGEASADFMRRRNEYIAAWGKPLPRSR